MKKTKKTKKTENEIWMKENNPSLKFPAGIKPLGRNIRRLDPNLEGMRNIGLFLVTFCGSCGLLIKSCKKRTSAVAYGFQFRSKDLFFLFGYYSFSF
ncbi:hypothetical protein ACSAZL_13485 [Methanosarcina sp. T3]|uniref:hypothetical protein n=1 Tax=Methanosarcina sp. T3 TaxID=3439062 RepID=UPI003F846452